MPANINKLKKTYKKWILNNENNCLLELVIKHKMVLRNNIFMQITHRGTKYLCSKTLLHMYLAITTATKKLKLSIRRQIDTNKLFRKRLVIADAFKWKSLILQKITFKRRTFNSRLVDWSYIQCTTEIGNDNRWHQNLKSSMWRIVRECKKKNESLEVH